MNKKDLKIHIIGARNLIRVLIKLTTSRDDSNGKH